MRPFVNHAWPEKLMSKPALVVIDVQNDYFEGGAFPLWNVEQTLAATEKAILGARAKGIPVVCVEHIANGPSPFFNPETEGVKIHERVRAAVARLWWPSIMPTRSRGRRSTPRCKVSASMNSSSAE